MNSERLSHFEGLKPLKDATQLFSKNTLSFNLQILPGSKKFNFKGVKW